ncbi:MAG: FAD-dependent oxidoreductase [Rhodospirillales bacterium]
MNHIIPRACPPRNIAVIGSGIAGMSAAWLLNQGHHITIFEINRRIGGHANTVDVLSEHGATPVDTGFIVYNEPNYPNLTALFEHLQVPTKESEMSFAASLGGGAFEYAGTDLNGLVGQRRNILRPRFWSMMRDLLRFYRDAPQLLNDTAGGDLSLGEYLERENYGKNFIRDHLLPMGAAIWSTTAKEMAAYPAQAFVRFFVSHGLLNIAARPQWRTVDGGSRAYVKRLTAGYQDRIRYGGVRALRRVDGKIRIEDHAGTETVFDAVVIATHANEAFKLLADPSDAEKNLLGAWRYTNNRAVLHTDASLMPKRRRVWSSWNFIGDHNVASDQEAPLCVTYWMNRLQSLTHGAELFVTLNPIHEPACGTIIGEFDYTHPFFDRSALTSQRMLWSLQGHRGTWFCGSYFGYGFHEDALQSGLAVAEQLGGLKRPWTVANESGRIHVTPRHQVAAA